MKEKTLRALTFKRILRKLRKHMQEGWVIKERVTSFGTWVGYWCVVEKRK